MRYIDIEKIKKELSSDNPVGWNDSDLAEKVNEYSNKIPMTNFERIKNRTIEQVASDLADCVGCDYCAYDQYTCAQDCEYGIKKWLEREAELGKLTLKVITANII